MLSKSGYDIRTKTGLEKAHPDPALSSTVGPQLSSHLLEVSGALLVV